MGAYNCESTLMEAVQSLLNQTFSDWELIVCDDGSMDGTPLLLKKLQEKYPDKIVALFNDCNRGLNYTLNRCLELSSGKFIARMDADDLCDDSRLEIELEALLDDNDVAFVSTDMELFDSNGVWGKSTHPEHPTGWDFLAGSPFNHAAALIRKEALEEVGGYSVDKSLLRVEDYHLWLKLYGSGFKGKNIGLPLYQARDDRDAEGRRKFKYRINEARIKLEVVKVFRMNPLCGIYAIAPIAIGILPAPIYRVIRRNVLKDKGRSKTQ